MDSVSFKGLTLSNSAKGAVNLLPIPLREKINKSLPAAEASKLFNGEIVYKEKIFRFKDEKKDISLAPGQVADLVKKVADEDPKALDILG